ncbi:hypothetical protein ACFUTY_16120 [Streptomyces sp. NPDC057362]|uniref:hypothetical protein n=1 Tax=Streptomyces sp. NPDC057362 TaxID=3346106 RepID=UPI00363B879C
MIEPESIPLFTGDLAQLEQHADALLDESDGIRQAGGEAHRQFQGLSAFYQAPEAEDLFASTAPARDAADRFGDKLATVAAALRTYAAEVAPIAKRLEELRGQAAVFVAGLKDGSGEIDGKWTEDADKVGEHQALLHDVNVAQAEFAAAEIACNNKITALVGGTQYVLNTGAKQFMPLGAHLYGYSSEVLDQARELPWGTPETQHHDWWDVDDFDYYLQHGVKSFVWDGLIIDNVVGTVDGVLSMTGLNGEERFKETWSGLARVVVGAETYLMESGGKEPEGIWATDFAQGSKVYAKEFGKSLVAWDMWDENPARASATVVFNVLTLGVGPLKMASAGKAGTAAKVASTVAKVGDAIDPISAAAKVTGQAVPRIAAVTERLRTTNHVPEVRTSTSVLEYSDGSGRTVLVVEDGRFVVMKNGEVIRDAPLHERSLRTSGSLEPASVREREPVGVHAASQDRGADVQPGGPGPAGGHETHTGTPGDRGGASATWQASGAESGASAAAQPPRFMREGPNPYGAPGSLTPKQIVDIQVYRANHEPGYREKYYDRTGRRLSVEIPDESGFPPPQLVKDPRNPNIWITKEDTPPPFPPKYVDGGDLTRTADTLSSSEVAQRLDAAALKRHESVAADNPWHDHIAKAKGEVNRSPTPENRELLNQAVSDHAPFHERMTLDSEAYGEAIARHHVIPEHYSGATWEDLAGPKNGTDQFDQLWRRKDGGFVVVEAKSKVTTALGQRTLPNGFAAMQGSKEYFLDIMNEMRKRGLKGDRNEARLYKELKAALQEGKVDYILVKGLSNTGEYAGYYMRQFDLS